ncbi:MAG: metal ABC transporter substrate-binding protein [Richelia sp.]|nr:metal ABC transporter substrate-binding protein [Richelia sp.]
MPNLFSKHFHANIVNFTPSATKLIATGIIFGLCLSGCNSSGNVSDNTGKNIGNTVQNTNTQNKKVILTTFTVLADMARNVAGDKVIVKSLTKPGTEIHGYEPTPRDIVRAQDADLILDNGFGLERWAQKFYGNLKDVPRVTLSQGITPINISEDAYAGKPNPHAWMSPKLAVKYVENIRDALIKLDPANAEIYTNNAQAYKEQIKKIDKKLQETVEKIPSDRRFMVTCEGAFSYLAKDYGLKEVYLWAVNAEKQATPQQVKQVITTVRNNQVPVVFCESTVSADAQKQVAKESNAKFGGVFYVDSLTDVNGVAPTYFKLLKYNINILVNGLRKSKY